MEGKMRFPEEGQLVIVKCRPDFNEEGYTFAIYRNGGFIKDGAPTPNHDVTEFVEDWIDAETVVELFEEKENETIG